MIVKRKFVLALLLLWRMVQAEFKIGAIVQLCNFLEFLFNVLDKFDSVFVLRIGELIKFVVGSREATLAILALEIEYFDIVQIGLRIFYDQEGHHCLAQQCAIFLIQLVQLRISIATFY